MKIKPNFGIAVLAVVIAIFGAMLAALSQGNEDIGSAIVILATMMFIVMWSIEPGSYEEDKREED